MPPVRSKAVDPTTGRRPPRSARTLGLLAMVGAILAFSLGSTIVKKSGIPGPTMAFWRMLLTSVLWMTVLWVSERRFITLVEIRKALVPGVVFGLNITAFFTGVTKTSVANAEFIGALTPVILVPAGALLFKERINGRALWFGLVSLVGLVLVLFNVPSNSVATWSGNFLVVLAMFSWATYLLTSRRLRTELSLPAILTSVMVIASFTVLPLALFTGNIDEVTTRSVPYIVLLAIMTGTGAHGLIVFAQKSVPVGTISMLQVAQPALAVVWAYLLLDQTIRGIQVVGMALVLVGLAAVVTLSRSTAPASAPPSDEPIVPES
ncbi:MAG: DMT family transporter [Acidimicrobiales bacterium]|nr:DMT family transporter [Acidimicrobiales bacterium]